MKLNYEGIKDRALWEQADIQLPSYDVEAVAERTKKTPMWVHFGIGNIFRIFLGSIVDKLLTEDEIDCGITCVETFDFDVVDKIYEPYDNLVLSVLLHNDGRREKRVLGAMTEALKAQSENEQQWFRLKEIFRSKSLQMVSFTITEKGYALKGTDGKILDFVHKDFENGPEKATCAMAIVTAMLWERFRAGGAPIALVSMDNCSQNGDVLRRSVLAVVDEWQKRGFVSEEFKAYVKDTNRVSFPWTMIDKITPRPAKNIMEDLEQCGVEGMRPVTTAKFTYIAPFVNAEVLQYLVIEDSFPNGRPPLEKAGVYLTDRETVNKAERMKVTTCLNPIHSALAPYGRLFDIELFSDEMQDPDMRKLADLIGNEGMEVVPDPIIISPRAFLTECLEVRFTNPYLGDTTERIATDISQGVGVRFGETVKAYMEKYGTAAELKGIPVAIAGWLRYLLAVNDEGDTFQLSPDPLNEELKEKLSSLVIGDPGSLKDQVKGILSNETIFHVNLYEAGLGEKIEEILRAELEGPGSIRRALQRYLP